MMAPLGPGKFYGNSLPRPRIYTDIKYSQERVDPPISVVDPLLSWANEAHWSMGGLCTKRLRLQGRIEGNIGKLRAQNEKLIRISNKKKRGGSPVLEEKLNQSDSNVNVADDDEANGSVFTPSAPAVLKRKRRFVALIEEDEEVRVVVEKKPARKLINEFNSVATTLRSAGVGGERDKSRDEGKSIGGSFVSRMKKASESLKSSRKCVDDVLIESEVEAKSKSNRRSPRLVKV